MWFGATVTEITISIYIDRLLFGIGIGNVLEARLEIDPRKSMLSDFRTYTDFDRDNWCTQRRGSRCVTTSAIITLSQAAVFNIRGTRCGTTSVTNNTFSYGMYCMRKSMCIDFRCYLSYT